MQNSGVKKLAENFYVRGDGTRCFYFEESELLKLFSDHGFACDNMKVHERNVENHKRAITMRRRWVQAIFTLAAPGGLAHNSAHTSLLQNRLQGGGSAPGASELPRDGAMAGSLPVAMDCSESHVPVGGTWLVGAAGRLAMDISAPPGNLRGSM